MVLPVKSTTFWRRSFQTEAIRLTLDNYRQIADYFGEEYVEKSDEGPFIKFRGGEAYIGEWLVKRPNNENYRVLDHEDMMKSYYTHSERMAEDERYARIHQYVVSAMKKQDGATYNSEYDGMDLVAIETTNKIIEEFS